jgi:multimeric flavodoxin WrbA
MKILGLSGGSTTDNTELLLKLVRETVKAAAAPRDSTISPVRIPDVPVPKHSLKRATSSPKTKTPSTPQAHGASIDDRPFVLDLILDASAIILCCPIYTRVIPAMHQMFFPLCVKVADQLHV